MRPEPSNGVVVTTTTSAIVSNRNCIITALSLNPAAAACTVALYDPLQPNTTTTVNATLRVTLSAPASVASPCLPLPSGIEFSNGCIAVVTGAGATASVSFAKI